MKSLILLVAGWLCLVLGVAGLALPFVPGTALLLTGAVLLAQRYTWARKLLDRLYRRFPKLRRIIRS